MLNTSTDLIIESFYKKFNGLKFDVLGILDTENKIHTLGTDSKIIGRVFEMFTQPILEEIAKENNLIIKTPDSQTIYPDFILMENELSTNKFAIDVKTTYVENDNSNIKFTLGSYGSYMRNNTKNIEYKYTDYSKHYVIGFVYKRNGNAQESMVYDYKDSTKIQSPFYDVKYFIQEKYKIAGDKPGSGNTENIGSFLTKNINDLKNGKGPFSELGADVFDLYWKYYPKYRQAEQNYTSISEFVNWFFKQSDLKLLHDFDINKSAAKINQFREKYHI